MRQGYMPRREAGARYSPLSPEERFGNVDLPELCERLGEAGFLHKSGGNWHWVQEAYPRIRSACDR